MTSPTSAERVRRRQDGDYEVPVLREPDARRSEPSGRDEHEVDRPDNG